MSQNELETVWALRKALGNSSTQDVTEAFIANLVQTRNNKEFIYQMRNKIWV
jgi:transcription termination factor Rho